MTVPTELFDQIGSQIRRSTGTSGKNEANQRSPGVMLKIQAQISAGEKALGLVKFHENVSKLQKSYAGSMSSILIMQIKLN